MSEPERIVLVVCPVCGRTDRWSALHIGRAHFSEGKKCDGESVEVEYVLRSQLAEQEAEVEQLREARDALKTARLALAFYAEGHFDHGKRARDDLAALHGQETDGDA